MIRAVEQDGLDADVLELARMWVASADARGYVIFGDPAVRLEQLRYPSGSDVLSGALTRTT